MASCAVLGVEGRRIQVVDDPGETRGGEAMRYRRYHCARNAPCVCRCNNSGLLPTILSHLFCNVTSPGLQDGFRNRWPPELVAAHVSRAVDRIGLPCEILTFDEGGVSGHPNHVDTCRGVRRYMAGAARGAEPKGGGGGGSGGAQPGPGVTCRELRTVPLYRKYLGAVGVLLQVTVWAAWGIIGSLLQFSGVKGAGAGRRERVSLVVCRDPTLAARALLRHRSQLVWYRLLYLGLSSYVLANELVAVEP